MKKKRFAMAAVCAVMTIALAGCSMLSSKLNDITGKLVGNSYTITTYDNYGNRVMTTTGDKINVQGNAVETSSYDSDGNVITGYELSSVITITIDGKEIELSFKEYELLLYFIENKGIALSREKILNNVWNYDYFGDARTIDTHVKKLRAKMGTKGDYIKTVWGMGYKFEVEEKA